MSTTKIKNIISLLSEQEIISAYSQIIIEMKKRGIVRTNNIVGELGEWIAINTYNETPGETKLQLAPMGTRNVDALSKNGERYTIKTLRRPSRTTGVFYGLNEPGSENIDEKIFEYVIVVVLDEYFQPLKILEVSWDTFIKQKKWHSRMKAWNLSINKNLEKECRVIWVKSSGINDN